MSSDGQADLLAWQRELMPTMEVVRLRGPWDLALALLAGVLVGWALTRGGR